MRRFYSPPSNFDGGSCRLDENETRHLRDVLRLEVGERVSVFDGEGNEFAGTIAEIDKRFSRIDLLEEAAASSPESPFEISIAPTILNGERYDLIIQKAVELGVTKLIPLRTIRCEVKANDAAKRLDRWRRIALEATKQSGRAKIMEIAEPQDFSDAINIIDAATSILFSERDGTDLATVTASKKITAFYGPKGGWDDSELELARSSGVSVITLGGRILRAETASIAITAILQHRFGDLR